MGIFSRLSDIVNSNLNAMLERAEEPQKMVRLMIREMEDTLVEVRSNAARTIADRKEIDRRVEKLEQAAGEWEHKAEIALTKEREDLAKAALSERAKLISALDTLRSELALLDGSISGHEADIQKLDEKLAEAHAKEKVLVVRQETAQSRLKVRRQIDQKRIRDAFDRFDAMERRFDQTEGEVEAFDLGHGKSLSEELADLEAEDDIDKELAAIKERLGGQNETQIPSTPTRRKGE
jgi:phage shock protein A